MATNNAHPEPASPEPDWTDQVTDFLVDTIGKIGDATTGKVKSAAKFSIYALIAGLVGIMFAILLFALSSRLIAIIPVAMWIKYLSIGGLLSLAGAFMWSKRTAAS